MLERQGGACAICRGRNKSGHQLHVDHDHTTGRVRALLCQQCNAMLGHARDDIETLRAAIAYLERHSNDSNLGP
ncbi:endonuclease VII domain-containing protein [Streptomyces sp. NBC_01614]|uniref:endonuclease VII domain-containing protein n=1 Tax=Streptomyces sp. NBC_01614 TaxID=2975897 RepID=UPI00386A97AB